MCGWIRSRCSTWNNREKARRERSGDRVLVEKAETLLRLIPRIFIAQMIAADCTRLAILVITIIAYRRRPVASLLVQMISACVLLICNLLTQGLQVAETFYNFQLRSPTANIFFNDIEGGIVIASMAGFAIGFCWYHLRHADRESLRGFPVDVTTP